MICNLMKFRYKNGTAVPDHEVAHMMIALLMAGQHSSSSTISWIVLRLAANPHVVGKLLDEQRRVLGQDLPPLQHADLALLPLHAHVIKETLRLHAPIHSIMRAVKQPLAVDGTPFVVPPTHWLMAAPGVTSRLEEHFAEPAKWDPHRWDAAASAVAATTGPKSESGAASPAASTAISEDQIDYGFGLVSKGTASPYLPFGAGRHRCIGEQFAHLQLSTILVALVRHLRWWAPDGRKDVVATDYSVSQFRSHCSSLNADEYQSPSSLGRWLQPTYSGSDAQPRARSHSRRIGGLLGGVSTRSFLILASFRERDPTTAIRR